MWISGARMEPIGDSYAIDEAEIGRGKYASCHRAVCCRTGAIVAVKRVIKTMHPSQQAAVASEVECGKMITASATCSSIPRYHDVWEDRDTVSIVMDLCPGADLFDIVVRREAKHTPFSEREVAEVMRALLCGIGHLHSIGVVHRDIKPENVVVDESRLGSGRNVLQLIDLGLALQRRAGDARMTRKVGTAYYVAPEVLRGEGYGQACDVWSAGVVAYVMLCGRPPFNGVSDRRILKKVRAFTPESACFASERFLQASKQAQQFVRALMVAEGQRLTAKAACRHPFIAQQEPRKRGLSFSSLCSLLRFRHRVAQRCRQRVALQQIHVTDDSVRCRRGLRTLSPLETTGTSSPCVQQSSGPLSPRCCALGLSSISFVSPAGKIATSGVSPLRRQMQMHSSGNQRAGATAGRTPRSVCV